MEKSRTEYSARNTVIAMVGRICAILMGFVARVVFTHTMSEAYVGISGLFTDILNVLALSELGVGTAITFALYKPIADHDMEAQKSIMKLYAKLYRVIAGIVLLSGLLVLPFMDVLIKDKPMVEHLTLIYLMYLFNSVLSYLWIYKKTLIDAHQQGYIGVLFQTSSWIIQNIIQIAVLILTKNFILYLSILMITTLVCNLCISAKANRMFPFLKEKNAAELPAEKKQSIYQNIRSMLLHKIGGIMVNNTDNLLLSALVGTICVGSYSNYYLLIESVKQVLVQLFQGITASVGNLGVQAPKERIKKVFEASFFIGQWAFGLASICLYEVLDIFVGFSFGAQYVFTKEVTLVLCINFYLLGMRQATLVFRESMGLFRYDTYKSIVEAVLNLIVSIGLGMHFGAIGVFLGTTVSMVLTSLWIEPYVLYKRCLKEPVGQYFFLLFKYALVTGGIWWVQTVLCGSITGHPLVVCISRVLVCGVVTNAVYWILYRKTKEFIFVWEKGKNLLKKYVRRETH